MSREKEIELIDKIPKEKLADFVFMHLRNMWAVDGFYYLFIEEKYGVKVIIGTHPIPQKYYLIHTALGTWDSAEWKELAQPTLGDERIRLSYD